jgi:hypothetical protein
MTADQPTATLIRAGLPGTGDARLYRLSAPLTDDAGNPTEYVIVSATFALYSGPETYIFPANADGKVTNWGELPGSFQGCLDHEAALGGAGYTVVGDAS